MDKLQDLIDYQIYCDMDDTVCDFEAQIIKITGMTGREYRNSGHTKDEFHTMVDDVGIEFWSKMPWMPDGKQLWHFIKAYKPIMLTAPMTDVIMCVPGKREWVKDNLGGNVQIIIAEPRAKQLYSNKKSILIDDRADTIDSWNARGGIGIRHTSAQDTINKLRKYLEIRT